MEPSLEPKSVDEVVPSTSNPETTTIVNVHFKIKNLWGGGGEVVKFGGEASPLPPPVHVDETLPIY